jgi:hypothetical protein
MVEFIDVLNVVVTLQLQVLRHTLPIDRIMLLIYIGVLRKKCLLFMFTTYLLRKMVSFTQKPPI